MKIYVAMSVDMNLKKLQETGEDREGWRAAIHGVPKSWTQFNNCITTTVRTSAKISFIYSLTIVWYSTAKGHKNYHLNSSQTEGHYSSGLDTKIYNIKRFFLCILDIYIFEIQTTTRVHHILSTRIFIFCN